MTRNGKHRVNLLKKRADKPIEELTEILNELEKMDQTKTVSGRLSGIIVKLKAWQEC